MGQLSEYGENPSVPIWHISVPFQHIKVFSGKSRGGNAVRSPLLTVVFQLQVWPLSKKE